VAGRLAVEVRRLGGPAADALVPMLLQRLPRQWDLQRGGKGTSKSGYELLARWLRLVPWKAGAFSWAALGAGVDAPPSGWRVYLHGGSSSFRLLMPEGEWDWAEWCPAQDEWLWAAVDALWPAVVAVLGPAAAPAFVRAAALLGYSTHEAAGVLFPGERAVYLLLPEESWVPLPSLVDALRARVSGLQGSGFPLAAQVRDLREAVQRGESLSEAQQALLDRVTAAGSLGGRTGGRTDALPATKAAHGYGPEETKWSRGGAAAGQTEGSQQALRLLAERKAQLLQADAAASAGGAPLSAADAAAVTKLRDDLHRGGRGAFKRKAAGGGGCVWTPLEDAALEYLVGRVVEATGHLPLAAPPSKLGAPGKERFQRVWGPLCAGVRALATPDMAAPRPPFGANQWARREGGIMGLLSQAAPGAARRAAGQRAAAAAAAAAEPLRAALASAAGAEAAAAALAQASDGLVAAKEETQQAAARAGETRKRKLGGE